LTFSSIAAKSTSPVKATVPEPVPPVVENDNAGVGARRGLGIIGSVYAGLREEIVKFGTSRLNTLSVSVRCPN
jgi:hypothetical protein